MASGHIWEIKDEMFYNDGKALEEVDCESETEELMESESSESCDLAEGSSEDYLVSDRTHYEQWELPNETPTKKSQQALPITPTRTQQVTSTVCPSPAGTHEPSSTLVTQEAPPSAVKRGRSSSASDISFGSQGTPSKRTRATPHVLELEEEEEWHDITDEDEQPSIPPFLPKRPPGPQLASNMMYSPLELFQLFFSTSVIKTIVDNTNKFAETATAAAAVKNKWLPLTVNEFCAYLSLVIYMGLVKTKNLRDYWSRKLPYRLAFPSSVITGKRFAAISSNLHLCDPQEDAENMKKKGSPGYDKLFKIKPLYTDIHLACLTFFHPYRELSIDERMVASKARSGLKQYMKAKPTKWGYKLFVLADSASGYTWNFFVYEGKRATTTGKGLSYDVVVTLLDHLLLGRGYKVYMDNFYTSPGLFAALLQENTLACGTFRINWQGFPQTTRNDLPKRAKRGTIRWCRRGKLLFVKWMDTREVRMCSTMHKAYAGDTVKRRVKNEQGEWGVTEVPVPVAVKDYNRHMGGVDLSDALIGYYNVLHKVKKWYKTFFFHFIDIAIVNSFILHQQMAKARGEDPVTQKVFREMLLLQLASIFSNKSHSPKRLPPLPERIELCMPAYYSTDGTSARRKCELCKKAGEQVKTPVYCTNCNVPLCLVPKRNCFKQWHDVGNHKQFM
ncbi:hypothetical protein MHYP_G00317790 [Metynnis hypsauchen]